jgi:hypothetical protein
MLVTLLEWGYTSQQIKDAFLFDYSISLECDDVGRQIRRTINIENCDELLAGGRGVRVSPNNTRPGVFVEFDERSDVGSDNGNSDDALPQEDPIDTTEPPGTGDEPADYDQNLTMGVNPSVNTCGLNELDFAGPNSGFEPSQVFQFRTDTDRADWICSKEITGSLLDVCGMGIKINSVEYTLSTNFNRLLPRLCGRR